MIGVGAFAGEQIEIQADSERDLEGGAHHLWPRPGPEPGDLLGQHCLFAGQALQLLPHPFQLLLQLLE